MADLPLTRFHKPVLSVASDEAIGSLLGTDSNAGGSAVWPSANRAYFVPLAIHSPYLVKLVWWANGTAVAGNMDCGVYSWNGTLLFSAGSTAQAGTSVIQSVALGTPYLLLPGAYYMALGASSASATVWRNGTGQARYFAMMGMAAQAAAVPLPATFTLATMAGTYCPLFGIARSSVI